MSSPQPDNGCRERFASHAFVADLAEVRAMTPNSHRPGLCGGALPKGPPGHGSIPLMPDRLADSWASVFNACGPDSVGLGLISHEDVAVCPIRQIAATSPTPTVARVVGGAAVRVDVAAAGATGRRRGGGSRVASGSASVSFGAAAQRILGKRDACGGNGAVGAVLQRRGPNAVFFPIPAWSASGHSTHSV